MAEENGVIEDVDELDDDDFDDPSDFVDDLTEEEALGELLHEKPKLNETYDNVIVIDGIPKVGEDRFDRLKAVILSHVAKKVGDDAIRTSEFPRDSAGMTKGYCFVELANDRLAIEAVKELSGLRLDKQHVLVVNLVSEYDTYFSKSFEQWKEPEIVAYRDRAPTLNWLLNQDCRDHIIVLHGTSPGELTVYQHALNELRQVDTRENWTETTATWSPNGMYLATFHGRGVAIWGGEKFEQFGKFEHAGVRRVQFSPRDSLLVTYGPQPGDPDYEMAIVWEVRTARSRRTFPRVLPDTQFGFSSDDGYLAIIRDEKLGVFDTHTPNCKLLDDKPFLQSPSLRDFGWSPTDGQVLAYWQAEADQQPARFTLIEVANKRELSSKAIQTVADCSIKWHRSGDYLCLKVQRYSKKVRKEAGWQLVGTFYTLEIFHVREKDIPVDTVEFKKEPLIEFEWEPVGSKFAVMHGTQSKQSVTIYGVQAGATAQKLKTLDRATRTVSTLLWAPSGQFLAICNLKSAQLSGYVEFVDCGADASVAGASSIQILTTIEHQGATVAEWDPTGRYLATVVTAQLQKVDNAVQLWTFQGRQLLQQRFDRLLLFAWRPRPACLLSEAQIRDLKKNKMKLYNARFDLHDKMMLSRASKELLDKRQALMSRYTEWIETLRARHSAEVEEYYDLRPVNTSSNEQQDEDIEFLDKVEEIVVD